VEVSLLNPYRLQRQRIRRYRDQAQKITQIEIAAIRRSRRLRKIDETRRHKHVIHQISKMSSAGVRDLISAANVRFIFTEPRQRPGESDGGTKIIPIVRPDGFAGLRRFRPDEFEVSGKIQVDAIVRTHPAIKAQARNTKQREAGTSLRHDSESLTFVCNAIVFAAHSHDERKGWPELAVVFE